MFVAKDLSEVALVIGAKAAPIAFDQYRQPAIDEKLDKYYGLEIKHNIGCILKILEILQKVPGDETALNYVVASDAGVAMG